MDQKPESKPHECFKAGYITSVNQDGVMESWGDFALQNKLHLDDSTEE